MTMYIKLERQDYARKIYITNQQRYNLRKN